MFRRHRQLSRSSRAPQSAERNLGRPQSKPSFFSPFFRFSTFLSRFGTTWRLQRFVWRAERVRIDCWSSWIGWQSSAKRRKKKKRKLRIVCMCCIWTVRSCSCTRASLSVLWRAPTSSLTEQTKFLFLLLFVLACSSPRLLFSLQRRCVCKRPEKDNPEKILFFFFFLFGSKESFLRPFWIGWRMLWIGSTLECRFRAEMLRPSMLLRFVMCVVSLVCCFTRLVAKKRVAVWSFCCTRIVPELLWWPDRRMLARRRSKYEKNRGMIFDANFFFF